MAEEVKNEEVCVNINGNFGITWGDVPESEGGIVLPEGKQVPATIVAITIKTDCEDKDFTTKEIKGTYVGVSYVFEVEDTEDNFPVEDNDGRVPTGKTKLLKTFPLRLNYWKKGKPLYNIVDGALRNGKVLEEDYVRTLDMSEFFKSQLGAVIMLDVEVKSKDEKKYNNAVNFTRDAFSKKETLFKTYEDFVLPDYFLKGQTAVLTV